MSPAIALNLALAGWALVIAVWDIRRRRVPDLLLIVVALPAAALLVGSGHGPLGVGFRDGAVAAVIGFVLTFAGYGLRQVGAGDVKYATLLGFLTGPDGILEILLLAALATGLLSLAALAQAKWRRSSARKVPAALALSAAFVVVLAEKWFP